jgi:hypothetical protein
VQASLLIHNGSPVSKGAWPWLAAIFVNEETGPSFACGGTLVTKNHVITGCFLFESIYFIELFNLDLQPPIACGQVLV